jgi:formamidopyrimidine-DNA glycosylase
VWSAATPATSAGAPAEPPAEPPAGPFAQPCARRDGHAGAAPGSVVEVPELPEVEALCRTLAERAGGRVVRKCELASFSALKTFEPPLDSLVGRTVDGCTRRGKHLCLLLEGRYLVIHLARAGFVQWREQLTANAARMGRGPLALRVRFDEGGFEVTEQGTEKRLALWVVDDLDAVPGIARLGPDPLDPGFDVAALAGLLRSSSGTLKTVLTDQSVLAGVGNAYSDEVLHAAHLSPFANAAKIGDEQVAVLYRVLQEVLRDAVERSVGLATSALKAEKRSGLRVHGRAGEACPVCGDTVREVSYATRSFQYCPTCQTGGKVLADRRLSRLLR